MVACSDSIEHETVAVDPRITLMVHEDNIKKIKSQTAADSMLIALAMVIKQGWPTHRSATDMTVRPYFSFWDEFMLCSKVILPVPYSSTILIGNVIFAINKTLV